MHALVIIREHAEKLYINGCSDNDYVFLVQLLTVFQNIGRIRIRVYTKILLKAASNNT
jgi:hypothetical protein